MHAVCSIDEVNFACIMYDSVQQTAFTLEQKTSQTSKDKCIQLNRQRSMNLGQPESSASIKST